MVMLVFLVCSNKLSDIPSSSMMLGLLLETVVEAGGETGGAWLAVAGRTTPAVAAAVVAVAVVVIDCCGKADDLAFAFAIDCDDADCRDASQSTLIARRTLENQKQSKRY